MIQKKDSKHFGNGEDQMPVRTIRQYVVCNELTPHERTFGRARWAEAPSLTGKGQKILILAGRTAHSGKSVFEQTTIQVFLHHTGDHRTPLAIMFFKPQVVLTDKTIKMTKQHRIERSLLGAPLSINLLLFLSALLPHERKAASRIAPPFV